MTHRLEFTVLVHKPSTRETSYDFHFHHWFHALQKLQKGRIVTCHVPSIREKIHIFLLAFITVCC